MERRRLRGIVALPALYELLTPVWKYGIRPWVDGQVGEYRGIWGSDFDVLLASLLTATVVGLGGAFGGQLESWRQGVQRKGRRIDTDGLGRGGAGKSF